MNSIRHLINSSGNHTVKICPTESSQINLVTHYIKKGILNGEAVFVIAKPVLRRALKSKMDGLSFDGQALQDHNQIRFFDAEYLLMCLKSDEGLGEAAFQESLAVPMGNAFSKYKRVRVFSEMVDILWKQEQYNMAIQLESFWKKLTNTRRLFFLCTYSLDNLAPISYDDVLERICEYHPYYLASSIERGMDEVMLDAFGAAWNRVIDKMVNSKRILMLQAQVIPLTPI